MFWYWATYRWQTASDELYVAARSYEARPRRIVIVVSFFCLGGTQSIQVLLYQYSTDKKIHLPVCALKVNAPPTFQKPPFADLRRVQKGFLKYRLQNYQVRKRRTAD
jgi:hypothetical protein